MKSVALWLAAVLTSTIVAPAVARAQAKPNFSGAWTYDAVKSAAGPTEPVPPGRGRGARGRARGGGAAAAAPETDFGGLGQPPAGPILIGQTDTTLTIGSTTYRLDGSPTAAGLGAAEARARWDGATIVIETTATLRGGPVTMKEVRGLDPEGQVMTVFITISGPRGQREVKQVFTKLGGV